MEKNEGKFFANIIKGTILSVICALVGILIFAFIIKIANLNGIVIKAVNQFIKILAIFLGCFFMLKENKGIIKGVFLGVFFTIIIYLIFALVLGNKNFGTVFFIDLLFGAIIGAVSGIISVNLKK